MTREEAVAQLESLLRLLNEIMDMPIGWGQVKPPVHPDDVAALDTAIAALRAQESAENAHYNCCKKCNGWISVGERLPERHKSVIVWTKYGEEGEAEHDGEYFIWAYDEDIADATHWMPLPEPPKEDTNA